jgi:predicted DNA-binding transcriptional regulator YafY
MTDKKQNAKTSEKKNVGNDKLRLLAVLKIMQRTDEDHPLTKNQIMNKVVEQGIEVSNIKTIAADLATLKDAGYDIVTNYSGSFMTDGQIFQNYELKILADNIANARYLPLEESEFIIERLREMATESGDAMIAATTVMDPKMKSKDITMKYKLDTLFRCIQKKKKVKFRYQKPGGERAVNYEYEVSPYALSLYEEEYYLTAAFAAGKSYSNTPFSFKVSRMERVEETDEPARKIGEIKVLSDGGGFADIQTYRRVMMNMWSGIQPREIMIRVEHFLADSKLVLSAERVKENGDGSLTIYMKSIVNTGLYQTLARYGDGVEILKPEEARKGYVEYLKRTLDVYEKKE